MNAMQSTSPLSQPSDPILKVDNLHVHLWTRSGVVHAVNGVSFEVGPGEVLGIVGESGSGKSIAMMSIMGLLDEQLIESIAGKVVIGNEGFDDLSHIDALSSRSDALAMIFQDSISALNPVLTVEEQIVETLVSRGGMTRAGARRRAAELLQAVHIPDATRCLASYPHQLSGGMCQRVMIAMAVGCGPKLLIADEPTTALDVTVQAQILALLADLRRETGMSIVIISHDLGVIAGIADRVHVMYAGRIVEKGSAAEIFYRPRHPYTRALLACTSRVDLDAASPKAIPGTLPDMRQPISGCAFSDRCPEVMDLCRGKEPLLEDDPHAQGGSAVACWRRFGPNAESHQGVRQ